MTGKTVYFRLPETEQKHKNSVTQEMLGKSISRAFRSYKAQFPQYSSKEYETVAKQFCEDFFLADEAIVANFANLSLQDNSEKKISLSIRISSHPVFNQHIPHNIAVAVIGYCPTATGSPVFIPERVFLTHGGMDATAYEKQVETHFYQLQENSYPPRSQPNLLYSDFTKSLPAYAAKTKERLSGWLDFLTFKNKLIKHKTQGLRYLNWQFNEETGQVHFLVIAEDEQVLKKARAAFSRQNLHAFKIETSDQPFRFLLPQKDASRVESAFSQLGQLAKDGVKIIQSNHSDKAKVKACEDYRKEFQQENAGEKNQFDFSKAVFADVFVDISEELNNKISQFEDNTDSEKQNGNQHTRQDKIDHLFRNLPKNGFLSISLVGDLALIERHRRAVKNLQQNEGCYAPYLSSYLFDIENANRPNEIPEITEWEKKNLNDKQKSAVQKMLAAPDICLIQGPPGTGKTTVIAEACLQFAKRGETVLLASQAHDALDNALSRLQNHQNHPELRAIRLAKSANRITEEGKQFTGESILIKHYVALSNYAKEYLQPFNELSAETEKLREWLQQAEFVAHDLQQLRAEYRTNQGRLKQAEQALIQAKIEFDEQQDIFRRHSRDIENIAQLIGLLNEKNSGEALRNSDFVLPETLYPLVEHLTNLEHLHINQPFSYERFLAESEHQAAILYKLIQLYQRIQAVLPKMEADLARLNGGNGTMGADTKTLLKIEQLQQEIDEIADKMENDDSDELSAQWKEKRKELRRLKDKPSEGLNRETYQIFNDAEHFVQNNPAMLKPLLIQRIQNLTIFQQKYQTLVQATVWDLNNQLQGYDLQPPSDKTIQEKQADLESLEEIKYQITERGRLKKQQAEQILIDGGFSAEADFLAEFATQQSRLNTLESELQTLQTENQDFMPLFSRWQEILKEPEKRAEKDWSELEKPFVESCNLVAITCNENERTLTENDFDGFDVVIIDEVSKATPLEMLLPLMRGKKAILVGDHRQLPPIFNEADGLTFEDEVEQNEAQENKQDSDTDLTEDNLRKFEKMVTASLFKELFEKAPESLRERLNIQFRMHPDIMKMINYFYEGQLTCGNPDAERSHGIEFKGLLSKKDHVLWIDTTDDEKGKRFSINDGQSNINVLEARMIAKTLVDMNRQLETLGYGKDKMKVGVVSFYQPQCRVIRDEIRKINKDKLSFSAIDVEINTVIRYQGKEKPIILLSLVKNNGGDRTQKFRAGRANIARFEFINVAMSRAQNLLLIFGARNMLENREVKLPRMDKAGYDKKMVYKNMFKYLEHWAETGGICDAKEFSAILPNIQPQQKGRR